MDQISPPFRIALLAMLALCAVWFTVLKPKDPAADAPLPTAPGATGLGNSVNAAKGAAATSDAANAKVQAATGGTSAAATATATAKPKTAATGAHAAVAGKNGGVAPSATAKPKTAATGAHAAVAGKNGGIAPSATAEPKAKAAAAKTPADGAAALLRTLDSKHAVVLLFWNRRGSDDRAVRRAVAATDRHHGHVVVKAVPVGDVGRYEAITRGAQVLQSPTVLVIGPDHKARAIAGFTTTGELDQVVGDTLAAAKSAK